MIRFKIFNITYLIIAVVFAGCNNPTTVNEDSATETENSDLIKISNEQMAANNMEIGGPTVQYIEDYVNCNGYITAPPNGIAQVSTQISGLVESINFSIGDYVKKGQTLCKLSSNEFIILQQSFAETSIQLKKLKSDYERSKILVDENIGAQKNLIAIESQYNIQKVKYNSLKLRLELLNLDISKIENGHLYSSFPLTAPISGYVTKSNVVLGEFIEQQENLFELVDTDNLHLQLFVFENNIAKMSLGQNIIFNSLNETNTNHTAVLTSIGKSIDEESKTILCIAKINENENSNFVNRTYVEAKIVINKYEVKALPNEAIFKSGNDYFVFTIEKTDEEFKYLKKQKISVGRTSDKYTELINMDDLDKVVIKGVYNLQTD